MNKQRDISFNMGFPMIINPTLRLSKRIQEFLGTLHEPNHEASNDSVASRDVPIKVSDASGVANSSRRPAPTGIVDPEIPREFQARLVT